MIIGAFIFGFMLKIAIKKRGDTSRFNDMLLIALLVFLLFVTASALDQRFIWSRL